MLAFLALILTLITSFFATPSEAISAPPNGWSQVFLGDVPSGPVLSFTPAEHAPESAGPVVDRTFPAFACEERSFLFYAGPSGKPNTFSQNLIDEIANRAGAQPVIRVGGTSLDHSKYNASQESPVIFPPGEGQKNVPFGLSFGPSYWDSFDNLPNARYILDMPLARGNLTNSLEFLIAGYESLGGGTDESRIEQLEIGNEPNSYAGNDRPRSYGPLEFVEEWVQWTETTSEALGIDLVQPTYQAVALASPRYPVIGAWNAPNLWRLGLEGVKERISSYSIHYYQTVANRDSDLQPDLMNHTAIMRGTGALVETVHFLSSLDPPLPLNIAEFGSALNPVVNKNNYWFESVLGSALWQVDFSLWLMSQGINRIHVQLGIGFGFAPWLPVDYKGMSAQVNAPFYAQLLAADFIGGATGLQVQHVDLGETSIDTDKFSMYAGYIGGRPAKLAFVNLEYWVADLFVPPSDRPSVTVYIRVGPGIQGAVAKRLTSPFGALARGEGDGLTWAGQKWTAANDGLPNSDTVETELMQTVEGRIEVTTYASEALILEFI